MVSIFGSLFLHFRQILIFLYALYLLELREEISVFVGFAG